jgi:hypothetical protein
MSATGPNAVDGDDSNARVRSAKWTSPANASVIWGGPVGDGAVVDVAAVDPGADGAGGEAP